MEIMPQNNAHPFFHLDLVGNALRNYACVYSNKKSCHIIKLTGKTSGRLQEKVNFVHKLAGYSETFFRKILLAIWAN